MKAEHVIELLRNPLSASMNAKRVAEKLNGDYTATRRMLHRMERQGIVVGQFDYDDETGGNSKFYSLVDDIPDINPDVIVEIVCEYVRETHHPALASLPTTVGGEQTSGSGHLSAWKEIVAILVEMGYIIPK